MGRGRTPVPWRRGRGWRLDGKLEIEARPGWAGWREENAEGHLTSSFEAGRGSKTRRTRNEKQGWIRCPRVRRGCVHILPSWLWDRSNSTWRESICRNEYSMGGDEIQ